MSVKLGKIEKFLVIEINSKDKYLLLRLGRRVIILSFKRNIEPQYSQHENGVYRVSKILNLKLEYFLFRGIDGGAN